MPGGARKTAASDLPHSLALHPYPTGQTSPQITLSSPAIPCHPPRPAHGTPNALSNTLLQRPIPGQRWISGSEPELGLGMVIAVDGDRVEICFPATEEMRHYAFSSAPLIRVRFKPGDQIADQDSKEAIVEEAVEKELMIVYHCADDVQIPEEQLLDSLSFLKPENRLLAGQCDELRNFDLRARALKQNAALRGSSARGFIGARIDLIPHQLAIATEASSRLAPRLLLSDEVGLGKTIEACLILHRLHLAGRADRILILVPEPLTHQWFVELLRRFNLLFAIFDEERCQSIQEFESESNPFHDSQHILCATEFLSENPNRAVQAAAAGFDLLIVDEAHHLEWHPSEPSKAYQVVENLATKTASVLLLTATPQQLGPEGHFARLRLLDPDRYSDLDHFIAEAADYVPLADMIQRITDGGTPTKEDLTHFADRSPRAHRHAETLLEGDENSRKELIAELIDSFGTGRVMFRNTREQLTGFPERKLHLAPITAPDPDDELSALIVWLLALLRKEADQKIVLICHSLERVMEIDAALRNAINLDVALFHEDLSLLQRDRNAAWFAEADGARLLICSEIGSEGRNFQFAHHLVLFDLPPDPELLEQRIGRLDRIGQTETIHIHVPYLSGTGNEVLARWYSEGLDAFTHPLKGATTISNELLPDLYGFLADPDGADFEKFLAQSKKLRDEVAAELSKGHDRLLELGAPSGDKVTKLIETIQASDEDTKFDKFCLRLFDQLGLSIRDSSLRSYIMKAGPMMRDSFVDIPEDGLSVTFDRATALSREDLSYLTPDHPMVRDGIDVFLNGQLGNASFGIWQAAQTKGIMLDCHFVLECLAPSRLQADSYLPPVPIRIVIDHNGKDLSEEPILDKVTLVAGTPRKLVSQDAFRRKIFPAMLQQAEDHATKKSETFRKAAIKKAKTQLAAELDRLEDLAQRNPNIPESEIKDMRNFQEDLLNALNHTRLRLDCLRLVWQEP